MLADIKAYLMSRDRSHTEEGLADLFALMDSDKDGRITLAELRAGLEQQHKQHKVKGGQGQANYHPITSLMALCPPKGGPEVFRELMNPNGPVDIPDAAMRAITLKQLKQVAAHAYRRCEQEGWLGKRYIEGKGWQCV